MIGNRPRFAPAAEKATPGRTFGVLPARWAAERARTVPTRHAATDCIVLLAGSRLVERPEAEECHSTTTHTVIQIHAIQAITKETRSIQCNASVDSSDGVLVIPPCPNKWDQGDPPAIVRRIGTPTTMARSATVEINALARVLLDDVTARAPITDPPW
jgi:hypothetical protein